MKKIPVMFGEAQRLRLDELAVTVESNVSEVARAAMYLGLQQILILAAVDTEKAGELVAINNFKAK